MARKELTIWRVIWRRFLAFVRAAGTRAAFNALFGFLTFALVLVIDLVANSLKTLQGSTLEVVRTLLLILGLFFSSRAITPFIIRYRDLSRSVGKPESSLIPVKVLRWFVVSLAIGCLLSFLPYLFTLSLGPNNEPKNPNTVTSIDIMGAIWLVGFAVLFVGFVRFLFLWQRTAELRRRIMIWLVPIALFGIMQYLLKMHVFVENTITLITLYSLRSLVIFTTLFLWFRIPWMPHVSRTEKNRILTYSALSAILSLTAFILYLNMATLERYAVILHAMLTISLLGLTSYFGLIFFNALFTLSSTELVERRAAEVQSLTKLTRFSSDVLTSELLLDIPKLADQITSLAREATKSDCAWLELHMKPTFGTEISNGSIYHSYDSIPAAIAERITNEISPFMRARDKIEGTLAEELEKTRRPVLLTTGSFIDSNWDENGSVDGPTQLSSLIAVPLLHKDELRGALYIAKEREYGFDNEDVMVLTAFSDIASLALDTARLLTDSIEKQKFDGELRAARAMQKSLLPSRVPDIPGFEVSAISIPAYEVGGDYYDFSKLWDGSPLIVIGDVSGKGISASIFMAETKGIVQALAPMMMSIREVFIGTNDAIMQNLGLQGFRRSFVTLAALSFKGNAIKYARAGHTPLLIVSPTGQYDYVQPKGMGIGFVGKKIFDDVLEEKEILVESGETIIIFSDGITEIRNAQEDELGYIRFAEIARAALEETDIQKMTDRILRDVLMYAGAASFTDDATFVVIRRL
ncbi:MAG: SpoIIE family protein phosphatase [Bacteroidota bacterium]|nr:SpoIIE family protein phosphatase [Bacteroidota bacterium]MDP4230215.1 SpoIIE family protein phosphatase [Bacteroidota bacterium]MDP4235768.1 SpoIIE family protein phosphatase [Bacteroidota bacterium]